MQVLVLDLTKTEPKTRRRYERRTYFPGVCIFMQVVVVASLILQNQELQMH